MEEMRNTYKTVIGKKNQGNGLYVSKKGNLLTNWATISFSGMHLLHRSWQLIYLLTLTTYICLFLRNVGVYIQTEIRTYISYNFYIVSRALTSIIFTSCYSERYFRAWLYPGTFLRKVGQYEHVDGTALGQSLRQSRRNGIGPSCFLLASQPWLFIFPSSASDGKCNKSTDTTYWFCHLADWKSGPQWNSRSVIHDHCYSHVFFMSFSHCDPRLLLLRNVI